MSLLSLQLCSCHVDDGETKGYAVVPNSASGLPSSSALSPTAAYPPVPNSSGITKSASSSWLSRMFNRNTSRSNVGYGQLEEEQPLRRTREDDEQDERFAVAADEEFEMLESGVGRSSPAFGAR